MTDALDDATPAELARIAADETQPLDVRVAAERNAAILARYVVDTPRHRQEGRTWTTVEA